jgi:hypothetical protein
MSKVWGTAHAFTIDARKDEGVACIGTARRSVMWILML